MSGWQDDRRLVGPRTIEQRRPAEHLGERRPRAVGQLVGDVVTAPGRVLAHPYLDQLVGGELRVGLPHDGIGHAVVADVQRRRQALPEGTEVAPLLAGQLARAAHRMYNPPLTCSVCPVMCRDSSLARNTATLAMSSGWAIRPSGMILAIAASSSSVLPPRGWAVSVVPGAIAFTRMPWGASSSAIVRVIVITPPLLAV